MPRRKLEEGKNRSIRLPVRLWDMIDNEAESDGVYSNNLIWRMVEEFLVKRGKLKDEDRKRPPLDQGK